MGNEQLDQLSDFQKGFLEGMEYIGNRMFVYKKSYLEDNVQQGAKGLKKIHKQIVKEVTRDFENQIIADELGMLETFTYESDDCEDEELVINN